MNITLLVGSLRKEAFTRKIAENLVSMAPKEITIEILNISDLALYNQDFDEHESPSYSRYRQALSASDATILITPEHNRNMPAALKNAIDIASRPYGKNIWNKRICAIISSSPSGIGGFGANHTVRQALSCVNAYTLPKEIYLGAIQDSFDEQGQLTERTANYLGSILDEFFEFYEKLK